MISENISHCCFSLHLVTGECKLVSFASYYVIFLPWGIVAPSVCVLGRQSSLLLLIFLLWCSSFIDLQESFFLTWEIFAETISCGQWFLFWPAKNYFCYFTNTLQVIASNRYAWYTCEVFSSTVLHFRFLYQNQSLRLV